MQSNYIEIISQPNARDPRTCTQCNPGFEIRLLREFVPGLPLRIAAEACSHYGDANTAFEKRDAWIQDKALSASSERRLAGLRVAGLQ